METLTILSAFGAQLSTAIMARFVLYQPAMEAARKFVDIEKGQQQAFGLVVLTPFLLALGWAIGWMYLQATGQLL